MVSRPRHTHLRVLALEELLHLMMHSVKDTKSTTPRESLIRQRDANECCPVDVPHARIWVWVVRARTAVARWAS